MKAVSDEPVIVFLGPSLPVAEARRVLPARYLSPVRCGDVLRVRRLKPRVIAIIDGLFETTAAVWHKEILLALEDGIAVFGAASMGALRAAELAPFGMVGVGAISEAYRDGVYTDDDEVAVLHGPAAEGFRARSDAMVNVRATVARAVEAGVIGAESAREVIQCAKETFYQERSLTRAMDRAWGTSRTGEAVRFRRFIEQGGYVQRHRTARARRAAAPDFERALREHCARLGEPAPANVEEYARALDFAEGGAELAAALARRSRSASSSCPSGAPEASCVTGHPPQSRQRLR